MTALATGQVLVMVSTGCRSRTIVLSYTPPAATTMSGPRLVILPFDDRRGTEGDEGDAYRVGGIYGGYGNRLARVIVTHPWPMQLPEALAAGGRAEGPAHTARRDGRPKRVAPIWRHFEECRSIRHGSV